MALKLWMALVLGLVQGVAEFLPISSSGHLALLEHFFQMEEPDNLFNILLHFATLIAVCVVYRKDIADMIVEFFRGIGALISGSGSREDRPPEARRLVLLLVLGTLPLFLVLPFQDFVEGLGANPVFICFALFATGLILYTADRRGGGTKTARSATVKDVLLIGLAQGAATVPGLSRSGCTISAGMAVGLDRKFAVRYSFLLSLPAVLGATLLELVKTVKDAGALDLSVVPVYIAGMIVAGVVGYFSIQLVKLLADKGKFGGFAYYCWAVALIALVASFIVR